MSYYDILLAKQLSGGGGDITVESLSVTANGTYTAPSGKAYTPVSVAVPQPTGTKSITTNGTHDVTDYASASVAVPNSYDASDEGKVVSSGALVAQTSQTIDTNGTYDTTLKDEIVVNVSGGGGSADFYALIDRSLSGNITLASGITKIGEYAFKSCEEITGITIPSGVTNIGAYAFSGCKKLENVVLPEGIERFEQYAFQGTKFTQITLPSTLTNIGQYAFNNSKLTSIVIPNSVTTIGSNAFKSSTGLTSVTCENTIPPSLGNAAFSSVASDLVIYVPASAVDTYKGTSGWSTYASKIQAIPT